jgi:Fe2+ or Zn2+ uptake regulation protein
MNSPPGISRLIEARQLFEDYGLRRTKQREVIYNALSETRMHPTAEELFGQVRQIEPGLSLATVYNTLEAFTRAGLCRRIPCHTGCGPCRYDAVTTNHAHVTTPDGRVRDVPMEVSEVLLRGVSREALAEVERRLGIRVTGYTLHIIAANATRVSEAAD